MSSEPPLVSVAVITYNQKEFLRECIDSVLIQDYPNFEIVVADDGSSDGTAELLREYETRHPNKFVLLLSKKNKGITENSNFAHFSCSGKYVAWMGGDDVMLPGKLSAQVSVMENNPSCNLCFHDADVFDSDTGKTIYLKKSRRKIFYRKDLIKDGTVNLASSTMVRASCTPAEGFRSFIPVASDWLFWVETIGDDGQMVRIDKILVRYRRHDANITRSHKDSLVGQNIIDHLFSASFIAAHYPKFYKEAMYKYSGVLLSLRFSADYLSVLKTSISMSFRWRTLGAIIIYLISFRKIKL